MGLLFKEDHQLLPDNFQVAKTRLTHVPKRLKSNPPVSKDQLSQGIIEEVVEPIKSIAGEVHYPPHHEVVTKDRETR